MRLPKTVLIDGSPQVLLLSLLVVALGHIEVDSWKAENRVDDGTQLKPEIDAVALGGDGDSGGWEDLSPVGRQCGRLIEK